MDSFPVDSSADDFAAMLEALGPRLTEWMRSLPDQASHAPEGAPARLPAFREEIPETGRPLESILDRLDEEVIPWSFNTAGPGYLAYIPGGGLPSAAIADLYASITNRYAGVWAAAPVVVEIEAQVLRWLAELMGMPEGSFGVMTTGGSISNLIAVVTAREKFVGERIGDACGYVTAQVHHCMNKALRIAGVPARGVRVVPVDDDLKMNMDALRSMLAEDRAAGRLPFLVCGSAGTTNTGSVDPLDQIADVCERDNLWFHVDGAYGAMFNLVPDLRGVLSGVGRADSLALDPHKGLFLPYGTGTLLVKDVDTLRHAHASEAAYLPPLGQADERHDFCNLSPELSRDWRGLRVWLPFMLHGVSAFREALAEKHMLTVQAAERLLSEPDVVLAHPPELSLFAFRQTWEGIDQAEENRRNQDLLERINAHRRIMITGTEIDGVYWPRICVLHLRTHQDRMDEAWEIIQEELAAGR